MQGLIEDPKNIKDGPGMDQIGWDHGRYDPPPVKNLIFHLAFDKSGQKESPIRMTGFKVTPFSESSSAWLMSSSFGDQNDSLQISCFSTTLFLLYLRHCVEFVPLCALVTVKDKHPLRRLR
jgi:hypothetical protein